ncbi:MAG: histidine kinase, partial [Phaeodactylibacter sp.]|nr:histidine kinase [Phaeodactylibacter sp.]
PTVWRSKLSLRQKVHATSHLLASSVFVFVFLAGVFSVPLLFALQHIGISSGVFSYFLIGWLSIVAIYYVANVEAELAHGSKLKQGLKFLVLFPLFLALSMGLSLHNTIAVIQGYIGKTSPFIRTPKFNIQNLKDNFRTRKYQASKTTWTTFFEGLLAVYFLFGILTGIRLENTSFLLFHLLLTLGFGSICFFTIRHLRIRS